MEEEAAIKYLSYIQVEFECAVLTSKKCASCLEALVPPRRWKPLLIPTKRLKVDIDKYSYISFPICNRCSSRDTEEIFKSVDQVMPLFLSSANILEDLAKREKDERSGTNTENTK